MERDEVGRGVSPWPCPQPGQATLTEYEQTHSKLKKHQDLSNEEGRQL